MQRIIYTALHSPTHGAPCCVCLGTSDAVVWLGGFVDSHMPLLYVRRCLFALQVCEGTDSQTGSRCAEALAECLGDSKAVDMFLAGWGG